MPEVHKELIVKCPKTIQHISMSILVLNKTITFALLMKIMQILSARPEHLGSSKHAKPKHPYQTQVSRVSQPS